MDLISMLGLDAPLAGLVSGIAGAVGQAAVSTPAAQSAIAGVQAQINQYKVLAYLAGGAAVLVFTFYFLPRFESPVPRIYRPRR